MSSHTGLVLGSLIVAVIFAAAMIWWMPPITTSGYVAKIVGAMFVGVFWYGSMRLWMACSVRSS
jgi:hypothetical protein